MNLRTDIVMGVDAYVLSSCIVRTLYHEYGTIYLEKIGVHNLSFGTSDGAALSMSNYPDPMGLEWIEQ